MCCRVMGGSGYRELQPSLRSLVQLQYSDLLSMRHAVEKGQQDVLHLMPPLPQQTQVGYACRKRLMHIVIKG